MLSIIKKYINKVLNNFYIKLYFFLESIYIYIYEFNYGGYLFFWFTTRILYYISYSIKYSITMFHISLKNYLIIYNMLMHATFYKYIEPHILFIKYFFFINIKYYVVISLLGLILLYSFRFIIL